MPYRLKKSQKLGLPPGVSRYSGDISNHPIKVEIINYQYRNERNEYYRKELTQEELFEEISMISDNSITWIDIQGIHDEYLMRRLAEEFKFHPILAEDLLSPQQRPKIDVYDNLFVVFLRRGFDDATTVEFETDQISIVVGKNFVMSFNELNDDKFLTVKQMIGKHPDLFTQYRNDFLAYILLDYVVDTYFLESEKIDAEIERLEDLIVAHDFDHITEKIHSIKKRNLGLKKIISPLRDIPLKIRKLDATLFSEATKLFLTDLEDHIYQLIDTVDTNRDLIANLKESYASEMSTRMNEVMMTLTVVSTILLPLTFLTSLYGMNFEYIPELTWRYSYGILWVVMIAISLLLTLLFRKRSWL